LGFCGKEAYTDTEDAQAGEECDSLYPGMIDSFVEE
jgi:hypothetical protein